MFPARKIPEYSTNIRVRLNRLALYSQVSRALCLKQRMHVEVSYHRYGDMPRRPVFRQVAPIFMSIINTNSAVTQNLAG